VPYPDKVLGEDEEVVRHLHPHWLTVAWPVVLFLVLVGATSFGAALVPAGEQQVTWRLVLVAAALVVGVVFVVVPLLRWRTTHYVVTTHRLLYRTGILSRHGRDIGLSRITDVSYRQSLWDRMTNSGTVSIETAGEGGPTVFSDIPDSDGVQQLLAQLVEEDADRRAPRGGHPAGAHDPSDTHDTYDGTHDTYDGQHRTERF
jgi:uncharacterized membrane protein YdbT with pleckstrin-like domain